MTRTKLIIICISILAICGILWGYIGIKEESEKLQKTIDTQKEVLYNQDKQIKEMTKVILGQEEELLKVYEQLKELQEVRQQSSAMHVKITHYSSEETGNIITASGRHAQVGRTVACNFLPLGTRVIIEGQEYTVDDRCGVGGKVVDIYVSSTHEALNKGTYHTIMEVL